MDTAAKLVNDFKAEVTSRLDNIDKSIKPSIVSALEDYIDNANVIDFFLSIASDESEYDLARIEVFKVLEIKEFTSADIRTRIGTVVRTVLSQSRDVDVRNYAAMTAASYLDIEGLFEEIDRILHDVQEPSDLRWNAFAAVKANGKSPRSVASLSRLSSDNEFKASASRLLSEWKVL